MRFETRYKISDLIQNRWEIYKILKGGMGIVYVVYDHEWHEALAAKTFQDVVFACNPTLADRFTQEAHAWVNLDVHQNVTQARFVEKIEGKPFLFLEYVSGGDLSGWIGTPRMTEDLPQVLRFAIQFCDGMMHALSRGIKAHRDIKPHNCLVTEDMVLKVTDFGLAKFLAINECRDSSGGTPAYMPPEQWHDFAVADIRSDIYSFGVMLYEMLTGRLPFIVQARTKEEAWEKFRRAHETQLPPPLINLSIHEITAIVQTCLAKEPASRFADFSILRERLSSVYETLTSEPAPQPMMGAELDAAQLSNKGVSLASLGSHEEAIACYDCAITVVPHAYGVWSNKGVTLQSLGRYEEALACYDRALTLNQHYGRAWNNKGNTLNALGRHEEALACYDRALALIPRSERPWTNKGVALKALERTDEALVCYNRALEINPHFEIAWYDKGIALMALGQMEQAIACYDRTIEINPRYQEAWINKGVALKTLGRTEDALVCYDHAISLNPRYVDAWYVKGVALSRVGRIQDALFCFDQAIELNPQQEKAWCDKGILLGKLERYQEALVHFDRAIQLNSRYAEAWYNKGMTLGYLGRYEEELVCYERVIKINPRDDMAWMNKGIALSALGRHDDELTCFDRALELNPRNGQAWYSKGVTLGALGRYEEEILCYDRAIEINPRFEQAWFNKGIALGGLGRHAAKLACYDHVLELNPRNAMAWYNKGMVLGHSGSLDEALVCFENSQRLGHPQAAQMIVACKKALSSSGEFINKVLTNANLIDQMRYETEQALYMFMNAKSLNEMRSAAAQFPFMKDMNDFILGLQEDVAPQVSQDQKPKFEQRLSWLLQIAKDKKEK